MAKGGFPGMGGANMAQLMKQAQKMQQDMQKTQEDLQNRTFSATAGGGMVTATVTGNKTLAEIKIAPECVDPDDVEMLQDLVVAAVNAALEEAAKTTEQEMSRITGGMNLGF